MVKGVPSEGWDSFFYGFRFSVESHRSLNRKLKTANRKPSFRAITPAAVERSGQAGKPPRKEDKYMKKSQSSKVKPISIRYTCAPNGDQVGLSHYLMADAKKAK
jgi:modified peptide precursor CbpA